MTRNSTKESSIALAIDVGGTNIKAALISSQGELMAVRRLKTSSKSAPQIVINQMLAVAHELCNECGLDPDSLAGIGISMAGFITTDGKVTATAHLSQDFVGYNLYPALAGEIPQRYFFSLDTPSPTLGEAYFGAGRGIDDFAYVTVSTGIGAGIMMGGKFFSGGLGWAGGVGHIIIDETSARVCEGCGNHGCLETFAASQGIITTARELLNQYPDSLIGKISDHKPENITPFLVFEAAQAGDRAAGIVFERAGHALGLGLVSLADIVAPSRIIVGGGIAQAGNFLLDPARKVLSERAFPPRIRQVEVIPAALGDLSAVYGAASMVFFDLKINSPME